MKIAITGKGGVGKTTLASLLAYHYAAQARPVLAIDADPSPCLGPALGFPEEKLVRLRPIAEMEALIAERTGSQPGSSGSFFKLNPRVDDLPDRFSVVHNGIRLLLLGAVERGGSGCICPESALLKQLVTHILLRRDEVVLLDLYAGVEHLGRATADSVDAMLIVVEPTTRSLSTARQIKMLAADIGVQRVYLVGNKTRDAADEQFITENSPGLPFLGCFPVSPHVITADRTGQALYELDPTCVTKTAEIADALEALLGF
ncbi:MAG: AAA family ATPase [Anaerolineae bacterium]